MVRYISVLTAAALLAVAAPSGAAQYEATLLPQRSIRYQTSFGLFEDDFDAFVRPRYLYRWDGARLATHLADIAPAGEASFGYGRAVTDGWSWSLLAAGGYARREAFRSNQRLFTAGGGDQLTSNFASVAEAEGVPVTRNAAQLAFGVNREIGPGMLGLGLQARWQSELSRSISAPPALFTLPSPGAPEGSGGASTADLDTGALFEASSFTRDPLTERRALTAALLAGYAVRKEKGWGYAADLLAGAEQRRDAADFSSVDRSTNPTGTAEQRYKTSTISSGAAPVAGLAITLLRSGRRPLWIDLGGEFSTGYSAAGDLGRTTGSRTVRVETGGFSRLYSLAEERVDAVSGTLGARRALTAGVRQSMVLDAFLQLGWGAHARYAASRDEIDVTSVYTVAELLDETGGDRSARTTHGDAEGQSAESARFEQQRIELTAPVALMIRSSSDAALEWRLGGEVRYRNELTSYERAVGSIAVPSGRQISADQVSSVVRYAGIDMPAGAAYRKRDITVNSALRAGVGYWFSPTAKVDAVVAGEPAGDGFLRFDRHSFGLSALLAF